MAALGRLTFRDVNLEVLKIGSRVETLNLCGAGREDAFHFTFTPNCVGKILYDSDTSSSLVEYLQKMSRYRSFQVLSRRGIS